MTVLKNDIDPIDLFWKRESGLEEKKGREVKIRESLGPFSMKLKGFRCAN